MREIETETEREKARERGEVCVWERESDSDRERERERERVERHRMTAVSSQKIAICLLQMSVWLEKIISLICIIYFSYKRNYFPPYLLLVYLLQEKEKKMQT